MILQRVPVAADDTAYDDERDEGPCGTAEQEGLAPDFINEEECRQCGDRVDDTINASCQQASSLASEAELTEDRRSVVDDGCEVVLVYSTLAICVLGLTVAANELLEEHNTAADSCAFE